jgi:hypothetical protein
MSEVMIRRAIEGVEVHPKIELPSDSEQSEPDIPVLELSQEEQASETTG